MAQRSSISDIVELLYDAVTNPERWPEFVDCVGQYFDADYGRLLHINPAHDELTFSVRSGVEIPLALGQRWRELLLEGEDLLWEFCRDHLGVGATGGLQVPAGNIRASCVYREVLLPAGFEHRMLVVIKSREHGETGLALSRGPEGDPFTQRDCDILTELAPHLNRAIRLRHQRAMSDVTRRGALGVLDDNHMGIVIIDGQCSAIFKNQAAEDVGDNDDGIRFRDGSFCVSDAALDKEMKRAVHDLIQTARDGVEAKARSFQIGRPSGAAPYFALICALRSDGLEPGSVAPEEPLAVLYLTDPDRPPVAEWQLLARLFGLTSAEGKLLAELLKGKKLNTAAKDLGIERTTARTQLNSTFGKTGMHNQAALLRSVYANAVWARWYGNSSNGESEPRWNFLVREYGLTPAEGQLLDQLVAGIDLDIAAMVLWIAETKAKAQLSSVLKKTGTDSLEELLNLVYANDEWMRRFGGSGIGDQKPGNGNNSP